MLFWWLMDRLSHSPYPYKKWFCYSYWRVFTEQFTFRWTIPIGIISSRRISHGSSKSPFPHKNISSQYWPIRTNLSGYLKSTLKSDVIRSPLFLLNPHAHWYNHSQMSCYFFCWDLNLFVLNKNLMISYVMMNCYFYQLNYVDS